MGERSINSLLDEIERRFHLIKDSDSAELVYRLRMKIDKLKASHHFVSSRLAAIRKRYE